jgi:hypothetical protein
VKLGGLTRRPEPQLTAILAQIECTLSDGRRSPGPLTTHAYLAEAEEAPRLIGILGLIDRSIMHIDITRERAFLRMHERTSVT